MKIIGVLAIISLLLSTGVRADTKDYLRCYLVEDKLVCEMVRRPIKERKRRDIILLPPGEANEEIMMGMAWKRTPLGLLRATRFALMPAPANAGGVKME